MGSDAAAAPKSEGPLRGSDDSAILGITLDLTFSGLAQQEVFNHVTWDRDYAHLATGAGKTKVISLAIVWSYFHALRGSGSASDRAGLGREVAAPPRLRCQVRDRSSSQ
jgi:hypothetical protein